MSTRLTCEAVYNLVEIRNPANREFTGKTPCCQVHDIWQWELSTLEKAANNLNIKIKKLEIINMVKKNFASGLKSGLVFGFPLLYHGVWRTFCRNPRLFMLVFPQEDKFRQGEMLFYINISAL